MRIALFLTYGYSLKRWKEAGILERELEVYRVNQMAGIQTTIISYGGVEDELLAKRYDFIDLCCNRWGLPTRIFEILIPFFFAEVLRRVDVIKTNQMYGAHVAFRCARKYRKPFYLRQGYSFFESQKEKFGSQERRSKYAKKYEHRYLKAADFVVFSTKSMANSVATRYEVDSSSFFVLPNYIVEKTWVPPYDCVPLAETIRIGFFGKLTQQKNLENLICGCVGMPVELLLIGEGPLRARLEALAKEKGVKSIFPGRLDQDVIAAQLRRCAFFVLPSHYEGHPKALIEMMAFGMPVLAANCVGIKDEIVDGETGILVSQSPEGLRQGIRRMIDMPESRRRAMGNAARRWALARYSLRKIAKTEREILEKLYNQTKKIDSRYCD